MNAMIDLRLDGQGRLQLVDQSSSTARPLEAEGMFSFQASAEDDKQPLAQAYALPPMPNIPSRKFFRH
jgi:hypothetical protein